MALRFLPALTMMRLSSRPVMRVQGGAAVQVTKAAKVHQTRWLSRSSVCKGDDKVERCVGANFHTEGEDPELKPDEEYPDWLWELPTRPVQLHEMEEGSQEYWRKLSKMRCIQNNEDSKIAGGR